MRLFLGLLFACCCLVATADDSVPRTTVRGSVVSVFPDTATTNTLCMILKSGTDHHFILIPADRLMPHKIKDLVEATVSVTGQNRTRGSATRPYLAPYIAVEAGGDIRILTPPPSDYPFNAKPLFPEKGIPTYKDITQGGRRLVTGYVKACWSASRCLVVDKLGRAFIIDLASDEPSPACGDFISVVGFPETNFAQINLIRAVWRHERPTFAPDCETAKDINPGELATLGNESSDNHGRIVRLRGKVVSSTYQDFFRRPFFYIESDGQLLMIKPGNDASDFARATPGCKVEITAVCILHSSVWTQAATFPTDRGFIFVTRSDDDIRILSRPSWWTVQRLLIVIGSLVLLLIAIMIWNRTLRQMITRKSHQLLKEQVGRIRSTLQIAERTNLAVELHDSLSQNLSGIACQIAAVKSALSSGSRTATTHVEIAERMLKSCRTSLRQCLSDLRENTLEVGNFSLAIEMAIAPITTGTETTVRFNVPRSRLSDTSAHAIICIIRELVANAIRHGKARHVKVAGESHGGSLSFSVRDDGIGFDPVHCDGPDEGHFGLLGVSERVKRLNGSMTINSVPGSTRIAIILKQPRPYDSEHNSTED